MMCINRVLLLLFSLALFACSSRQVSDEPKDVDTIIKKPRFLTPATVDTAQQQSGSSVPATADTREKKPLRFTPTVTLHNDRDQEILDKLLADMVVIPAGMFRMGDIDNVGEDDELPVRNVAIRSFAIGRYEVTFEQFDVFVRMTNGERPRDRWGRGRQPVIDVNWHDAMKFAQWVSNATGVRLRLPTEAEWEYAARAGSDDAYSFGNDEALLCDYANIADSATDIGWRNKKCSDGFQTTAPVGSFKPNAFGLYDMHGNVWEWLSDCWFHNYKRAPVDGRHWTKPGGCSVRAQRGGSWFYGADEARSSYRSQGNELDKSVTLGFRLARDI